MKKPTSLLIFLCFLIFSHSQLLAQWSIGGSFQTSPTSNLHGFNMDIQRHLQSPADRIDFLFQLNGSIQPSYSLLTIQPIYTDSRRDEFPPVRYTINRKAFGGGVSSMLRYTSNLIHLFTGPGIHVYRINRKLTNMEVEPLCEDDICVQKYPMLEFTESILHCKWSLNTGIEIQLSHRINPYIEYRYYGTVGTFPHDAHFVIQNHHNIYFGVRINIL